MEVSEKLRPTHEEKMPRVHKAERTRYRVTFNPSRVAPGETLNVAVQKLDE